MHQPLKLHCHTVLLLTFARPSSYVQLRLGAVQLGSHRLAVRSQLPDVRSELGHLSRVPLLDLGELRLRLKNLQPLRR